MREEKAKALQYYVQLGLAISIFVTFLGGAYNYFQTTAAENFHYIIVIGIISYVIIATISYFLIIKLFYLFKWYQFEKIAFLMPLFLFIYIYLDIPLPSFSYIVNVIIESILTLIFIYIIIKFLIYIYKIKYKNSHKTLIGYMPNPDEKGQVMKSILKISIFLIISITIIIISMFFWSVLFIELLNSPFQGNIMTDMESIYHKNDTQIPISIQVTGPNTELLVILFKEESGKLYNKSIIYLEPQRNIEYFKKNRTEVISKDDFTANSQGNGKYIIFINTSNLTSGYYELLCLREKYNEKYSLKSFYLLNNS